MKRFILIAFLILGLSMGLSAAKIHKIGGTPKVLTVTNTRYTISEFENSGSTDTLARGGAYALIADAVTALDGHGGIIQVENETLVEDDLTIPANVRLILAPTAAFAVATTKTLTVNCQVEGVVRNTGAGSLAYGTSYAVMTPIPSGGHDIYVDASRGDTYTADGTIARPYSTIALAMTAVNADVVIHGSAGTGDAANYVIHVGSGTYSGALTITGPRSLRIVGTGVVISGTIAINSGVGSYDRIEFIGTNGGRSEKGPGMTLSGKITATRTDDSLIYVGFHGCLISGQFEATTSGTWVLQYENCRVNGAITGTFAVNTELDNTILIESYGFNEFVGTISGIVSMYNCNGSDFYCTINTTPWFENRFTHCSFNGTSTIAPQGGTSAANKVVYVDGYSYKSAIAKPITMTGATYVMTDNAAQSFTTGGAGAKATTGNTVVENAIGSVHTSTFTLASVALTLTAAGAGVGFGNVQLYDFPEGYIYFIGAVADLDITSADADLSNTWNGDIALGTTADADGSLAGTELNIIPKTSTPAATAKATTGDCVSTATEHAIVDGHSSALDLFLNLLVDAADIADASTAPVAISGTITVTWIKLGDN